MSIPKVINIPKVIVQTSRKKPQQYIVDMIRERSPGWEYKHFVDDEIMEFFADNPVITDIPPEFDSLEEPEDIATTPPTPETPDPTCTQIDPPALEVDNPEVIEIEPELRVEDVPEFITIAPDCPIEPELGDDISTEPEDALVE